MKTYTLRVALAALVALTLAGCDLLGLDDRPDPNGPSLEGILDDPSEANLSALAVGIEAASRVDLHHYLIDVGMVGREYWHISAADPRFTADLLGRGNAVLDNNTFYITRPWGARYANVRNGNTMLLALDLNTTLSDAEKAAGRGWARTWIAYQYLLNLNLTWENGIRFIEPGQDEGGPVVGYAEALTRIAEILDLGAADLDAAGDAFFFPVSSGFDGFDTPPTFRMVNRGLAARVALYREDYDAALDFLAESFIDPAPTTLGLGAYHVFGPGSGDLLNPFFLPPDATGEANLVHPSFVTDAEPGDTRLSKAFDRGEETTFDGLTSRYGVNVYTSSTSPIPIIRNAELILIRAEARAQTGDLPGAIVDLNLIRTAAGLPAYSGPVTLAGVLDEVLRQRRYELYAEGHRWVDVRRFGLLGTLPIDRPGDDVWDRFPIPLNENV
ncbi:MAG TPA: RagB/SusD family nutrient uptake outer membrane protein [Rubricoccaceae bacterium]|nr:RagB/SusD family nutrient uptake outer membrane protein [Rubricoccaceae bacterium]